MAIIEPTKHDIYPFISPHANLKDSAKGKTILVTGASRGLGKSYAIYFALAGARALILTSRRPGPLEECRTAIAAVAPDCKLLAVTGDAASEADVEKLFAAAVQDDDIGVPDVLVNNAGGAVSMVPMVESEIDAWWGDVELNLKSTYLCSRAFLHALDSKKPGRIINISSLASLMNSPTFSSYSAAKIAVNALSQSIDSEGKEQNLRSFAIHPGGVMTDLAARAPEWIKAMLHETAELSAGLCLYLATERADYLAGRWIDARWDMEELEGKKDEIVEKNLLTMGLLA